MNLFKKIWNFILGLFKKNPTSVKPPKPVVVIPSQDLPAGPPVKPVDLGDVRGSEPMGAPRTTRKK